MTTKLTDWQKIRGVLRMAAVVWTCWFLAVRIFLHTHTSWWIIVPPGIIAVFYRAASVLLAAILVACIYLLMATASFLNFIVLHITK